MIGKSSLFMIGLVIAAGGVLFKTSYEVQTLDEKLGTINARIVAERDTIRDLVADWNYLSTPTRIEALSQRYLKLLPADSRQYSEIAALPMRTSPAQPAGSLVAAAPGEQIAAPLLPRLKPAATPSRGRPAQPSSGDGESGDAMGVLIARLGATR